MPDKEFDIYTDYENTLKELKNSFKVEFIAVKKLITCEDTEESIRIKLKENPSIDQFPLTKDGHILFDGQSVEVIERNPTDGGAKKVTRAAISLDKPILEALELLKESPYYCLLRDKNSGIFGIVTRTDLLKLPVRVLIFAQVSHLESIMHHIIMTRWPSITNEQIIEAFPLRKNKRAKKTRGDRLLERKEDYKNKGIDLPLVELLEFSERRTFIHNKILVKGVNYSFSKRNFDSQLGKIETLRNFVAHAGKYVRTDIGLEDFVKHWRWITDWIDKLGKLQKSLPEQ